MEWVSTIYQYAIVLIVTLNCHVFAVQVFWSDEFLMKGKVQNSVLIATNIQSNLSGSSLEHDDPQPLQIENYFSWFLLFFSTGKHLSCSTQWSPALKAPSAPSFTKIQVVACNKTRKMERRLWHHQRRRRHSCRKRQRGKVGCSRVEPFVGCLFPWHNSHGGAWNKTLLITHTRVRIEWDQQHGATGRPQNLVSES